ncbi:AAA domain-containing protein [Amycolatopsis cynarae]|uniref:AAA domain-containing protein n=1 Tax=Amycolatopsis cynarae TaxID=2995223 RepID=A0ABY7AYV5_9PSEU|nr:AAA domain-containing protein [Amycolatopsis sp. HUAS 11-8]WAL63788.1 AAA domain-containing protein [Amycolatopsis sp. HUAS 11-8]
MVTLGNTPAAPIDVPLDHHRTRAGNKLGRMNNPVVEQARNLFEFLLRAQELKAAVHRVADVDAYKRDGLVLWLSDLPEHPAVALAPEAGAAPDDPLLTIGRIPRLDPPAPGAELSTWLTGPFDDPSRPPTLREAITTDADGSPTEGGGLSLAEHPQIRDAYETWAGEWRAWAGQELRDRQARAVYNELFSAFLKAKDSPEDLELVAGTGLLAWSPQDHPVVRRHLFSSPLTIHFDDETAQLSIVPAESPEPFRVELDMLDPGLLKANEHINEIRASLRELQAHPLDASELNPLARRLVHALDGDGVYHDDTDELPDPGTGARGAFAPAVILRKRSQRGLVEIFRTIVAQLAEAEAVPDGVIPLIDADHLPKAETATEAGALVQVDGTAFLPMPVNDKQRQIIEAVDTKAQVLVQGPPGTGKTYTAAALISHLLAQGKRVLVTAQTDRALREVRDKLPAAIQPLSVAVVGTSREDMADLKTAVQTISTAAHEHDSDENARVIEGCLGEIDRLRRERAELYHEIVAVREREVRQEEHAGYRGTLAAIAQQVRTEADRYGWLADHTAVGGDDLPPLRTAEIIEWRGYLLDDALAADESEARMRLPEPAMVPDPDVFADLVAAERSAAADGTRYESLKEHSAFDAVLRLPAAQRQDLQRRLHELADEADTLASRREDWMDTALRDVRSGRAAGWQARGDQIGTLIEQCAGPVDRLGLLTQVEMPEADSARLAALAREVHRHLDKGGKIKTAADGTPKLGTFAPKVLKQAQPLFDAVRVDGLPPTNPAQLDAVTTWVEAVRVLTALDRAWPEDVHIPAEDTLQERLQWHRTELEQLNRVLRLATELEAEEERLAQLRLPAPDWNDLQAVRTYATLVDAATAEEAHSAASEPLSQLQNMLAEAARWAHAAPCVERLRAAVEQRDHDEYGAAHGRFSRLCQVRELCQRRDGLGKRLAGAAPELFRAIASAPAEGAWADRLGWFAEAWTWAATRAWVQAQEAKDVNVLQARITRIEDRIHQQVELLASRRAWDHAASPERIGGSARADLTQYAQLVQRGGKLTGKYAAQQKAAIRAAMDRCRPSVPVWIMPLYRIAEQLRIRPGMFDVVIVDEASQAGLEATFLQYLAPKIVVIGDDKQVSPTAVGVDQQQLRDLAGQYIPNDRYRESWQDPTRSLFDEAKMRYGGLITLTEHRRCVPEIIGFSNRIAYEPEGIRLIPVRQYGADRLDPVKAVYLPDGYQRGGASKINPVEAEAIVDQIEECLADPAYSGRTFGVISLLGQTQAKYIENLLLERIGKREWTERDLRCGDAPDFQGSERDVMFLSMVAAPEPGQRLASLTRDLFVQRYNVAVSRAKDQVWVFHSIDRQTLHNPEDMRFQLLDYCYGVINRGRSEEEGATGELVPEDERVSPFDSLFEQRVYNRIIDRGYTVIPQHAAAGYLIDLVVIGGHARLAVECDGDHWHGPDKYDEDLARQRDLERCGWRFFRIRESAFYVDPAAALAGLWAALRDLDIHPAGGLTEPAVTALSEPVSATPQAAGPEFASGSPAEQPEIPEPTAAAPHPAAGRTLEKYQEFTGSVTPVAEATREQLITGLRAIVEMEGPILGDRLHAVYVRASGGHRVGKQIASTLNSAISAAVRAGVLVRDNPLSQAGVKPQTYRLPERPEVRIRERGPRSLDHVPPSELAALMAMVADDRPGDSDEEIVRHTAQLLGVGRLTQQARELLERARSLVAESWH